MWMRAGIRGLARNLQVWVHQDCKTPQEQRRKHPCPSHPTPPPLYRVTHHEIHHQRPDPCMRDVKAKVNHQFERHWQAMTGGPCRALCGTANEARQAVHRPPAEISIPTTQPQPQHNSQDSATISGIWRISSGSAKLQAG